MGLLRDVAARRPVGEVTLKGVAFKVQMVPSAINEMIVRQLPEPKVDPDSGYARSNVYQNDLNKVYAHRRYMLFLSALDVEGQVDDDDRWTPDRSGDWCNAKAVEIKRDFSESAINIVVHEATFKLAIGANKIDAAIGSEDAEGN
jgi:hypothetical protein